MSYVIGADELIRDLQRLGADMEETKNEMLQKGGEWLAAGWKDGINRFNLIKTGSMLKNVRYKLGKHRGQTAAVITSYGKDEFGTRNAAKAYIQHYGSSRITATHWIDWAEDEYGPMAIEDMGRVLAKKIEEKIGG